MTDEEIVKRAKEAEKRTSFGELVHSPISITFIPDSVKPLTNSAFSEGDE